jgi:hypothetical protein
VPVGERFVVRLSVRSSRATSVGNLARLTRADASIDRKRVPGNVTGLVGEHVEHLDSANRPLTDVLDVVEQILAGAEVEVCRSTVDLADPAAVRLALV